MASDTRERLEAAALAVVGERGVAAAGVSEIARRAGLTTGAIYANYQGKDELIAAAMLGQHERTFRESLGRGAAGDGGFVGAVTEVLAVDAGVDHRPLLDAITVAARDPELAARMASVLDGRRDDVRELLDRSKADGVLDPEVDTAALAHVLHLIGLGSAVAQVVGTEAPARTDLEAVIRRLAAGLLR